MAEIKIGDKVRNVAIDSQGWQTILQGDVIALVDEFAVVKVTHHRLQHRDHPERGRDLPARGEVALLKGECDGLGS
ncbi:MAG: hypothetical protein E6Q97_37010 [Desulfurellales bacterium]|nr:MAG: hypothetical protein E6Q97_37010 [Desulfurellales bacterium]